MKAVVSRVKCASVKVEGKITGAIDSGFLVLLGIKVSDTEKEAKKLAAKICNLRIFEDEHGKMNRSLSDTGGGLLVVSQFTLYADCKSRRPGFTDAARPDTAIPLYELFLEECKKLGFPAKTGVFGADMAVESINDGPVTIIIDTEVI